MRRAALGDASWKNFTLFGLSCREAGGRATLEALVDALLYIRYKIEY